MNPPILLFVCAWILCSSDTDASPKALLPRLLRELQDRGRGDIPAEFALMTLEGIRKEMWWACYPFGVTLALPQGKRKEERCHDLDVQLILVTKTGEPQIPRNSRFLRFTKKKLKFRSRKINYLYTKYDEYITIYLEKDYKMKAVKKIWTTHYPFFDQCRLHAELCIELLANKE